MIKRLFILLFVVCCTATQAQCPQIYDGLGTLTSNAQFVNCIAGDYSINFQSNTSFGTYTINWGDGTANTTGASYTGGTNIPHTYTNTIGTFTMTYIIGSPACTQTALVVMERPVSASIQIPIGGVTQACAPRTMSFTNSSTNVSSTTTFTWDFGDGSAPVVYDASNLGQNVTHQYLKGTVNCQTQVTLKALNYCRFSNPSVANYNPIQIYDIDDAAITPDKPTRCFPDNQFTFNNTTNRNCVPEGNTFQRQERWNLGNYWGYGHDSIINWRPWPPTSPITVAFPASVGSYTVALLDSNLCGVDIQVLTVNIVNSPTAGVISPPVPLCQNTILSFSNTSSIGYSYKWDFGDGGGFQNLGAGVKTHVYTTPGIYTVSLVAQLGNIGGACSDTARIVVNVLGSPTANFTVSPTVGCNNLNNVAFTDLSTSAASWQWTFGNGNTSTSPTPPLQNYVTIGAFTASLVVTGTTSCINTKTASIIVRPNPVASFPLISPCVGSAGTFSSTSIVTGTNPIVTYKWDFGDGGISTASNTPHTYTSPVTYPVKLVVATSFCSDSITKSVVVNVRPTADFVFTPTINCPPFVATFTNNSTNASLYLWDFGTAPTSTLTNPTHTFDNTTQSFLDYTVTLVATTGAGCSDTRQLPVSVKPKPVAIFNTSTSGGCSPLSTTLTNNSIGATTYSWDYGDGNTSTLSDPVYVFSNISLLLKTNTITLIATNSVACSDAVQHSIQVFPQALTSFTMNPPNGCTPLTVNFPSVPGIVSYTWNFGDGTTPIVATSPTVHVFTNTTTANQTYTVKLVASNAFGCVDSSFKQPTVFATPIPSFAATATAGCAPFSTTLTNASQLADAYLWRFGDGSTSTLTSTDHLYLNGSNTTDKSFICTLFAYSADGCTDSIKKVMTAYYKPDSQFLLSNPQCTSTTVDFTNLTGGVTNSDWFFGDSPTVSNATSPSHTYTNNTINNLNYTVQLISTSGHFCKDTAYGYPVIYAHPIASYNSNPGIGCSPLSNTVTSSSLYAHSYIWEFGDGTSSATGSVAAHAYTNTSNSADQTFTCTLIAINNNGCKDSLKKNIVVYYKPDASFVMNSTGCNVTTINFTNTSTGLFTPTWHFGDNTSSSQNNPIHTYTNTTISNLTFTAQLVIATGDGCGDTAIAYPVIYAHPEAHFSMTPLLGCSPLSTSLTNSSALASTYKWEFGDGAISTGVNASHTYTNTSNTINHTFTTTLIAKNSNGCSDSITQQVLVFYKPKAQLLFDNPQCTSQTITFTNTSLGNAATTWSFGDGTPLSPLVNPVHNYTNTTGSNITYSVQMIVSTPSLCVDTAYGYPQVYALPEALFSLSPTQGCSPLLVTTTNSSSAAQNYKWLFGDGSLSTAPAPSHAYINPNNSVDHAFSCTLVAINNNGCKDSMQMSLLVLYKPEADYNRDTLACTQKVIAFNSVSHGASNYLWNFADGHTTVDQNPTHQYINNTAFSQTFAVSLQAISPNGCRDTVVKPLIVHPKPDFPIIASPDSGCAPVLVHFSSISGVSYYDWSYNNSEDLANHAGDFDRVFSAENPEVTVRLIATDEFTCIDTSYKVIKVFPSPIAEFAPNPTSVYIPNQATNMHNSSVGATSYLWDFGDGSTSTDYSPSHTYTAPGDFQIILVASNDRGCRDTAYAGGKITASDESTVQMPNAFTPDQGHELDPGYTLETDQANQIFHPYIRGADRYEFSIYSRWGELLFFTKNSAEGWNGYYKGQLCTQDVYIWKIVATFFDGKIYKKTGDLLLLR